MEGGQLGRGSTPSCSASVRRASSVHGHVLGGPPARVQGPHQLPVQPLKFRVRGQQPPQLGHQFGAAPERQFRLDPVLYGGQPQLREPGRFGGRPVGRAARVRATARAPPATRLPRAWSPAARAARPSPHRCSNTWPSTDSGGGRGIRRRCPRWACAGPAVSRRRMICEWRAFAAPAGGSPPYRPSISRPRGPCGRRRGAGEHSSARGRGPLGSTGVPSSVRMSRGPRIPKRIPGFWHGGLLPVPAR